MKLLTVALIALTTTSAFAVDFIKEIDDEIFRISSLRSTTAGSPDASASCKRRYANLFNKDVIKVSYGFGYADSTPGNLIWDYYMYNGLVFRLTQPCTPGATLCGFAASGTERDTYRKAIRSADGSRRHTIEIRITKGSLTAAQDQNVSPANDARQKALCQSATTKFMREIAEGADIVMYTGHSRNGGGPDFCPPVKSDPNHVDYAYYQTNRPGIQLMTAAMATATAASKPNQIVGMFSCSSQLHFYRRFAKVNKVAGYILTGRTATFEDVFIDSYTALDGLLNQRCVEGLTEAFNERGATSLKNMFAREL